ncbi:NAD(P)H-binding protein [Protofrankia symbiont of Coriaria ruscifolia]|nr:NAD(P)H-binding protein [Protofrankia symbiont of Coriaria ruscifolia]
MILITGAMGNVGREVVNLLLAEGEKAVAVTRDPATAALPDGAAVVGGDPSHPTTLTSALRRVEAVLVSPRAVGAATAELLALAAEHGAQRVVALSAVTVEHPAGYRRFAEEFKAVEDAVTASGLPWTILRCTDFASNTRAWAPQIRSTGIVRGAYGDAATSTIHERDIAAVAVRALVDADHAGHSYLLTGPQSLTQRDKVRLIGQALGTPLSFEELPPDQVRRAMLAQGLPEDIPDRLLGSLADYATQPGPSSDTVAQILDRPALTFADWATEHTADFGEPAGKHSS